MSHALAVSGPAAVWSDMPKRLIRFPLNNLEDGIPENIAPYWTGDKLVPKEMDFYPNMQIQGIALEIFTKRFYETKTTDGCKYNAHVAYVKLELEKAFYLVSLHLFPIMRIKQRVFQFEVYTKDEDLKRTPIILPDNMAERLLELLIEGRPSVGFTCMQFVNYLNDCYVDDELRLNNYEVHAWDREELVPGMTVALTDDSKTMIHAAIYVGDNLYLWHLGPVCLQVTSLEEMLNCYTATKKLFILKRVQGQCSVM